MSGQATAVDAPAWLGEFFLLSGLWGASFLFMRLGAAEFGPFPTAGLRVALATVFLWPILVQQGQIEAGVNHLREARLRAPSAPEFRLRLAAGLSRLDRKAEAREELKAALGLAPGLAGRPDVQALRQHLGQ